MSLALRDFDLEVYLSRHEFSARHYLCGSDGQTMTVGELLGIATANERAAFDELALGYSPTWGASELRAAIAAGYDDAEPEDVLTFAGAEESVFWAMQELLGPGDHALITVPVYQSTETVALSTGADVTGLPLDPGAGWALDLDELRAALRPTTRVVAVNFPHNPTGAVPDAATFRSLVDLCDERGIHLFSDEVYRGVELDPASRLPQAADISPTALSLGTVSKSYGLPGLRIGWIVSHDRELLGRLERRKHYTSICSAAPSEALATIALRHAEVLQGQIRSIVEANVPVFDAFFERWADLFEWAPPRGGCVCFPRYLGDDGVEELCRALIDASGTVLLPASVFRSELAEVPADRFRIGLGRLSPEPGLAAFDAFLAQRIS